MSSLCFVLFLVVEDGGHLGMPNCTKSKWFHARILVTQILVITNNSIEVFFLSFHILQLITEASLTDLLLLNFETTKYKNHLTQIWSKSIQQLLRYCQFLVCAISSTGDGGHLGMPNCEKSKWL